MLLASRPDRRHNRLDLMLGGWVGAGVPLDTAEVWLIRADVPGHALSFLHGLLDERERSRVKAWRHTDRRRFIVAHGATRLIIAARLGVPPAQLRYTYGRHGKPELAGLQLSLSHSGEFCMLALSPVRAVGVDIQHLAIGVNPAAMATRYFPPAEAHYVTAARPVQQAVRFARLWARKEALVKAYGGRLVTGLSIPVSITRRSVIAGDPPHRLTDIPAPRGFRAAIALSGRTPFRVRVRRWRRPDHPAR